MDTKVAANNKITGKKTGFIDKKGVPICIGDDGTFYGIRYHVAMIKGTLVLEKWCGSSITPLADLSASYYEITFKNGKR